MAADQLNFDVFNYVDDHGVDWNKRGETNTAINTVDGSTAFGDFPSWGRDTPRHSVRKIQYRDPTTFRTKTVIFYTAAAWSAVSIGTDVLAVHVPGNTATVDYVAYRLIPERSPSVGTSRKLADHA